MTQAAKRPSTATRRTGGSQPTPNGHGPRSEQDLRGEQDLVGDRDRDDGNKRDDRDSSGTPSATSPSRTRRERASATERGEQWHGDRGELGDGREPRREPGGVQRTVEQVTDRARAATSNPGDAFASNPRHVEGRHGVVRHGRGHDEAAAAVLQHRAGRREHERPHHHEGLTHHLGLTCAFRMGKDGRERQRSRRLGATCPWHHTRSSPSGGSPARNAAFMLQRSPHHQCGPFITRG